MSEAMMLALGEASAKIVMLEKQLAEAQDENKRLREAWVNLHNEANMALADKQMFSSRYIRDLAAEALKGAK